MGNGNFCRHRFIAFLLIVGMLGSTASTLSAQSSDGATHLYFFTNDGCAPCRQVEPGIEALKRDGYPVTTIKASEQPQFAAQYQVDRTPTVILVSDNQIKGRHAGIIDGPTLRKWFAAVGMASPQSNPAVPPQTQTRQTNPNPNLGGNSGDRDWNSQVQSAASRTGGSSSPSPTGQFSTPTMLHGTDRPGNSSERIALQATVRLKVEDPEGISYATGTVIHSHQGECLVMTCGHVFRDSAGKGTITAEYDFGSGRPAAGPGTLIYYDADARDIGLVAIQTDRDITPVKIAARDLNVQRGRDIFTVGCDHGESPTIRRSRIKNQAKYNGTIKYDIHGRPVDGRSGGGLFTESGELIGVCNAAAVEVDEGIYTALDTVYWQLAKVGLEHLFDRPTEDFDRRAIAAQPVSLPTGRGQQTFANSNGSNGSSGWQEEVRSDAGNSFERPAGQATPRQRTPSRLAKIQPNSRGGSGRTPVSWNRQSDDDQEVIIIIRSKSDSSHAEAITVSDPSPQLLEYLKTMQNSHPEPRQLNVANMRQQNQVRR